MLKIRLQGTLKDIQWFRRILEKHKELDVLEVSDYQTKTNMKLVYGVSDTDGISKNITRSDIVPNTTINARINESSF